MRFLTAYYWQQEEYANISLVLQHLVYPKEQTQVIFACICKGKDRKDAGYGAEILKEWFQRSGRELARKDKSEEWMRLESAVRLVYGKIDKEIVLNGLIIVGERFLLFGKGERKVWFLNTRFRKANCKEFIPEKILAEDAFQISSGRVEKGVGLLLATPSFGERTGKELLCQCLSAKELSSTQRLQKRLSELGEEEGRRGAGNRAAILVVAK